jgi:hypothetical protein
VLEHLVHTAYCIAIVQHCFTFPHSTSHLLQKGQPDIPLLCDSRTLSRRTTMWSQSWALVLYILAVSAQSSELLSRCALPLPLILSLPLISLSLSLALSFSLFFPLPLPLLLPPVLPAILFLFLLVFLLVPLALPP